MGGHPLPAPAPPLLLSTPPSLNSRLNVAGSSRSSARPSRQGEGAAKSPRPARPKETPRQRRGRVRPVVHLAGTKTEWKCPAELGRGLLDVHKVVLASWATPRCPLLGSPHNPRNVGPGGSVSVHRTSGMVPRSLQRANLALRGHRIFGSLWRPAHGLCGAWEARGQPLPPGKSLQAAPCITALLRKPGLGRNEAVVSVCVSGRPQALGLPLHGQASQVPVPHRRVSPPATC